MRGGASGAPSTPRRPAWLAYVEPRMACRHGTYLGRETQGTWGPRWRLSATGVAWRRGPLAAPLRPSRAQPAWSGRTEMGIPSLGTVSPDPALEGGKWGEERRPRSGGGPKRGAPRRVRPRQPGRGWRPAGALRGQRGRPDGHPPRPQLRAPAGATDALRAGPLADGSGAGRSPADPGVQPSHHAYPRGARRSGSRSLEGARGADRAGDQRPSTRRGWAGPGRAGLRRRRDSPPGPLVRRGRGAAWSCWMSPGARSRGRTPPAGRARRSSPWPWGAARPARWPTSESGARDPQVGRVPARGTSWPSTSPAAG